jgi:insulysin
LAAFNYLELLRSSTFESFHHEEVVKLSAIRFRFAEKRRPDNYATWLSEHMAWPIPRDLLLAAPRLTWEWDNEEDRKQGEARVKEYLDHFRIGEGRAVLMAKKEDHLKLHPDLQWENEPWYGTGYAVQRFDDDFITKVNFRGAGFFLGLIFFYQAQGQNTISEFHLPRRNEFIPNNLDVDKKEGVEVGLLEIYSAEFHLSVLAPETPPPNSRNPAVDLVAQKR